MSKRKGKSIRAEKIHKAFEELLKSMKPKAEMVRLLGVQLFETLEQKNLQKEEIKKRFQADIQKLNDEQEKIMTCMLEVTEKQLISKFQEKISLNRSKIDNLKRQIKQLDVTIDTQKLEEGLKLFADPLKLRKASSVEQKRKLLKMWFKTPFIVNRPFSELLNQPKCSLYQFFQRNNSKELSKLAPPGVEPGLHPSQGCVLSIKRQGHLVIIYKTFISKGKWKF